MIFLKLLAVILTGIILVPSGAHLLEFAGKIDLARDAYFTVQSIYAGWSLFAIPIFAAILANLALTISYWRRRNRRAVWFGVAAALIACSLIVFFIWVFPGNQQMANWTSQPDNGELLRRNWEHGHATNAVLVFAAFVASCIASVSESKSDENNDILRTQRNEAP